MKMAVVAEELGAAARLLLLARTPTERAWSLPPSDAGGVTFTLLRTDGGCETGAAATQTKP